MTLSQLFDALHTLLPATPSLVEKFVGDELLEAHGSSRRVTWIPVGDSFTRAKRAGTVLWEADTLIEAHVRAESRDVAQELADEIVRALEKVVGANSYSLKQGDWMARAGGALVSSGPCYVLQFTVKREIDKAAPPTATATQARVFVGLNVSAPT